MSPSSTTPGPLVLVLGGARAGKSRWAEAAARAHAAAGDRIVVVATAEAFDDDMAARIARHRAERPAHWETREAPRDLARAVEDLGPGTTVLIDCLTLWTSNLLLAAPEPTDPRLEHDADAAAAALVALHARTGARWIVVSNEVGLGVVPATALGGRYRDALGRVNARVAAAADQVVLLVAGLPLVLKGAPASA